MSGSSPTNPPRDAHFALLDEMDAKWQAQQRLNEAIHGRIGWMLENETIRVEWSNVIGLKLHSVEWLIGRPLTADEVGDGTRSHTLYGFPIVEDESVPEGTVGLITRDRRLVLVEAPRVEGTSPNDPPNPKTTT